MRLLMTAGIVAALTSATVAADVSSSEAKRIHEAAVVLGELHAVPDKDIPQDLWQKANCVAVVPGLKKAAFIVGGEFGKGLMSCRTGTGWSAPIFLEVGKGSFGFQVGAESVDLIFLVMNSGGMEKLLHNKVSLGADASVAAGPVGRDARAATDAQLKAEILSYSRTQGVFAGIDLSGGVVQPDKDDNVDVYGPAVAPKDVLLGKTAKTPAAVEPFIAALKRGDVSATSGSKER
jgi:lipid-binding SYLF domain-containing protein